MRVIYVGGPFRGPHSWAIEQNIRRAEEIALELWKLGAAVICPHANTRFFQGAAPDDTWLRGDLEILGRCDAMVVVPGWEKSEGTTKEVEYSDLHNIQVFNWDKDQERIKAYLDDNCKPKFNLAHATIPQ